MYAGYQGACYLQCPPKKAYYLNTIYWVVQRIQPTENLPCHSVKLSYTTACYLFHSHCPHPHKKHFLLLQNKQKKQLYCPFSIQYLCIQIVIGVSVRGVAAVRLQLTYLKLAIQYVHHSSLL